MSRSLILSFNSTSKKYFRLKKQIKKSVSRGEFWRFTKRRRSYFLHKIERLRRRLVELRTQIKFATAGAAMAMMMMAGTASAQNTSTSPLGPFNPAPMKNPMPPPPFAPYDHATLSFVDMDGDGDLDATLGNDQYFFSYYLNQGNAQKAYFKYSDDPVIFQNVDLEGYIGDNRTSAAFADIDDDGDIDMVVGQSYTNITPDPDFIYFFENDAGPNATPHYVVYGEQNPFGDIALDREGWPVFADIDNDGDQDLIVAGVYYDSPNATDAWIQVFRNDKEGHEVDVDAVFTPLPSNENPLYMEGSEAQDYVSPAFADMDEDGDLDFIYSTVNGSSGVIRYKRNDNGMFVEQEGPWEYNPNNPGASTGNPFSQLLLLTQENKFRSLAFGDLDGDGDQDLTVGLRVPLNAGGGSTFVYIENTGHGVMTRSLDLDNPITGVDFGDDVAASTIDYDNDGDLDVILSGSAQVPTNECSDEYTNCLTERRMQHAVIRNDEGEYHHLMFQQDPFDGINPDFGSETPEGGTFVFADVDGDSDVDVFMMFRDFYPHLEYFRNDGGEYTQLPVSESPLNFLDDGFQTINIDFADLDGDNLLDLVLGEANNRLRLYKNTGAVGEPVYTQQPEWETGFEDLQLGSYVRPKFVDLDNDGDMDIVVGKYRDIYYYENIGTPTNPTYAEYVASNYGSSDPDHVKNPFTNVHVSGGSPDAPMPLLADFDNDGDKDLLFGSQYGTFTYYENQNPTPVVTQGRTEIELPFDDSVILDPQINLEDSDNDKIAHIIIKIEPFDQGKERLDFDDVFANIEGSWNDDAGELTLTGTASIEDFELALRSVEYVSLVPIDGFERKASSRKSINGRTIAKTITFTALDADLTTATSNTSVYNIVHTNELPAIAPVAFNATYNSAPLQLIPAVTVTDSDDGSLHSAEVAFTGSTFRTGEDELSVSAIAGITSNFDSSTGVLTLSGPGSLADYQTILRSLTYTNLLGAGANTTGRTLSIKVYDGESDSNAGVINLSLFAANNPPVLAPATTAETYTGVNLAINPGVTVTDDGTTISSATVIFTNGFVPGEDKLLFTNQNGITGSFNDTTAVLSLSGGTTLANYQAALRSVQYSNVATVRTAGVRSISFVVTDGAFSSNASVVSLTIPNTPPTISGTANSFWATGEVVINNNVVLSDTDNSTLEGATVTISSGFNVAEDELVFTNQNGITGTTAAGSPTLTLSGTSSVANYQAALRSVRYKNSSSTPSTSDREFTFTVTDGGTTTVLTGSVVIINKPPTINLPEGRTRAGGNIAFVVDEIFLDPDDNLDLSTIEVTSSHGAAITVEDEIITIDYRNQATFKGMDDVSVSVCDTGGRCTTEALAVEVGAEPLIYTGLSPNGDGINDWFHIEFLAPGTKVSIYNRWGDAVFESDDYDTTNPAKRFEGKNKNGTELIAGAYFYKITYPDKVVKTGNLLLNR